MKKDKLEKEFWLKHFGIPHNQLGNIAPEVERLNFKDEEVNDDALLWITTRIKRIGQLDLDNTSITDEGIKHLASLESIKELRLKGCNITKDCLGDLNKLGTLELLHLGNTPIGLDDVPLLASLQHLSLLLVSSSEAENVIEEKVFELKFLLPECTVNVNYKTPIP